MITSVQINNFQTHRDRQVVFGDGITVIGGDSDVGKSSVIRAIRWALMNQPRGDAFVTFGESETEVLVSVDGQAVERGKKGDKNRYRLNSELFHAFGADVPSSIQDVVKVDELNFQNQHDAPFWVSLSCAELSRRLNQIVDLEVIDKTLSASRSDKAFIQRTVEAAQHALSQVTAELQSSEWVDAAQQASETIKAQWDTWSNAVGDVEDLERLLGFVEQHNQVVAAKTTKLTRLAEIGKVLGGLIELNTQTTTLDRMCSQIEPLTRLAGCSVDFEPVHDSFDVFSRADLLCSRLEGRVSAAVKETSVLAALPDLSFFDLPALDSAFTDLGTVQRDGTRLSGLVKSILSIQATLPVMEDAERRLIRIDSAWEDMKVGNRHVVRIESYLRQVEEEQDAVATMEGKHKAMEAVITEKTEGLCPICGGSL